MSFHELLGRLAAEHKALQVRYDNVVSENQNLRLRLSCTAVSEQDDEALQPDVRQFEQEAVHMARDSESNFDTAEIHALTSEETRAETCIETPGAVLKRSQRQFRLHPCFLIKDEDLRFMRPHQYDLDSAMQELHYRQKALERVKFFRDKVAKANEGRKQANCLVMHPSGNKRLVWDLVSMSMLAYDCIMTPLILVMDAEPVGISILGWIVNGFWTLDIFASLTTGFFVGNQLIMDLPTIAKYYLPRWFIFDAAVILPDWATALAKSDTQLSDPVSALRAFKMLRFLRLMRLLKVKRLMADIFGRIDSGSMLASLRLLRLLAAMILVMHIIACFWFLIGDHQDGWAAALRSADLAHRYFASLNWSLAQMQGHSSVVPVTNGERIYASITILISLAFVSLLIGATTAAWQNNSDFSKDLMGQRTVFRSMVQQHKISQELDMQIHEYLEGQALVRKTTNRETKLMKLLPHWLLKELLHEIWSKAYINHPLFQFLSSRNGMFMRHVCCDAMAGYCTQPAEIIFNEGDACAEMRFVAEQAILKYLHRGEVQDEDSQSLSNWHFDLAKHRTRVEISAPTTFLSSCSSITSPFDVSRTVTSGQFLSEAAIWTIWENCGLCVSASWGTLLLFSAANFQSVVTRYPEMHWMVVLYARQFIMLLNKVPISDVLTPPSVKEWDLEAVDTCNIEEQPLPWEDELPSHIRADVVKAAVNLSLVIAAEGLDENRPHHGFTVIVGDAKRLASCGRAGFNPFQGHDIRLVNNAGDMDKDVFDTLRRNAFHGDGAIVLDGMSGKVIASGWFVENISLGGSTGGARSRSSKAVAQQAGESYVIKCSEDSRGKLILHLGTKVKPFIGQLQSNEGTTVPTFLHSSRVHVTFDSETLESSV